MADNRPWPQAGLSRMIARSALGNIGTGSTWDDHDLLDKLDAKHVFMMGDNPALPRMPEKPTLIDFFKYRFNDIAVSHLLGSAKRAMDDGRSDTVVMACMLHDISNGCLIRPRPRLLGSATDRAVRERGSDLGREIPPVAALFRRSGGGL